MKRTLFLSCFCLALLLVAPISPGNANAQAPSGGWSAPLMLYRSDLSVSWPIVVTDAYGTVHVFWVEGTSEWTPTMLPGGLCWE